MKKDGHTHTEFCPHGSGEDVELLIQKAIKLEFTEYSITEHAPLPSGFYEVAAGNKSAISTAGMNLNDVEIYLKKMHQLKKKYSNDIKINVGFEVDYLPGFENWTVEFLNEYGMHIDDSILSLHFLLGKGGFRSVDFSPEDYQNGIIEHYGSFQKGQEEYFRQLIDLVQVDLGEFKPKRIGHITLCQKFKEFYHNENTCISDTSVGLLDEILSKVKLHNYELDFNAAGVYKPYCGEPYPNLDLMEKVKAKEISYVYGSDAHSVQDVGRGYSLVQNL